MSRIRTAATGLVVRDGPVLLVKGNWPQPDTWLPPGGGQKLGEPLYRAVEREVLEETGDGGCRGGSPTTRSLAVLFGTSRTAIHRTLLKNRRLSWIFIRDPDFRAKAQRVLDLHARTFEGAPLGPDEYVLSSDEKISIQAAAAATLLGRVSLVAEDLGTVSWIMCGAR
ncbi:NUDIX domain-containing protein [Streptomyces sp. NBC_01351]|nr:NUDIX domain-containing protein [Streptomyces sp. NBC_01351]